MPAAGITRDSLAVKIDKETGRPAIYPVKNFREVTEVNLYARAAEGLTQEAGARQQVKEQQIIERRKSADGSRIEGIIPIDRPQEQSRLSDVLNDPRDAFRRDQHRQP